MHAWYEYIAGGAYNKDTDDIPGNPLYWADQVFKTPGVADIIPLGFDLDNGGFSSMTFTKDKGRPLDKVLEHLVTGRTLEVHSVNSSDKLLEVYRGMAGKLKMAAQNAYFVDQLGDSFTLQTASTVTKLGDSIPLIPKPQITVKTYDIYTKMDVGSTINGVEVTDDMRGQVKSEATTVEVVTFSDDGTIAKSNLDVDGDGDTSENIIVDGIIVAKYFWYNTTTVDKVITLPDGSKYTLPSKTFYWNIGTISDKKFELSYYVYLEGATEGTAKEGVYETNNYATLNYVNWLNNQASKEVESPILSWGSAAVYYGFYLVDSKGNPVTNRATGETGRFQEAVKVTSKLYFDEIPLNAVGQVLSVAVQNVKPAGYTLFDAKASYTIRIDSSGKASGWQIVQGTEASTTYVTDYRGNDVTTILNSDELTGTGMDYTATTVWFAVVWDPGTVDDVVVIDYGLPVEISVMENDMFGSAGILIGLGDVKQNPVAGNHNYAEMESPNFAYTFDGLYGKASITSSGNKVRYVLNSMEMPHSEKICYEVRYEDPTTGDLQYYYGTVTIIPATTVYYEDSFLKFGAYDMETGAVVENRWKPVEDDNKDPDAVQDEDRPGGYSLPEIDADNLYGYDSAYTEMSMYSLGSAQCVNVNSSTFAQAEFTFYGTGFDVISLTSNTTGTIIVDVYAVQEGKEIDLSKPYVSHIVDTYYGFAYQDADGDGEIEWVPVDTNDPNALYQIPVMKICGLPYGRYKVIITAVYDEFFDHEQYSNKSYDFYMDAIRIYDPAGKQNDPNHKMDTDIEDAYIADSEGWPLYVELRNNILSANSFDDVANGRAALNGLVFIDGNSEVGDTEIADYTNYGPNNELYLAPGQDIAFMVNLDEYERPVTNEDGTVGEDTRSIVATVQIGIKSASGRPVDYVICNITESGAIHPLEAFTVSTSTDMYYNITVYCDDVIAICNTSAEGSGEILSLTNIKVTFTENPQPPKSEEDDSADAQTFEMSNSARVMSANSSAGGEQEEKIGLIYMTYEATQRTLQALSTMDAEKEPEIEDQIPETTVPEETEPETTVPETTEPTPTEPEVTEPETTEPEETEPEVTEPETTEPETTEPEVTEPETTEPETTEPVVFEPRFLNVFVSDSSVKVGEKVIVTVITSADVESLTVNGREVKHYIEGGWIIRTRTWIVALKASKDGEMVIDVVAYDDEGVASGTTRETVDVREKKPSFWGKIPGKKHD